jgi:hypothetical protein
LACVYVENRLDRKPEGFLIGLLRYARTSLSPTTYGLKPTILVKSNSNNFYIFF